MNRKGISTSPSLHAEMAKTITSILKLEKNIVSPTIFSNMF